METLGTGTPPRVLELVDELLDAHVDTLQLAQQLVDDPKWSAHSAYLRDLQRIGREELARLTASAEPTVRPAARSAR
jgi:hypothetical protein